MHIYFSFLLTSTITLLLIRNCDIKGSSSGPTRTESSNVPKHGYHQQRNAKHLPNSRAPRANPPPGSKRLQEELFFRVKWPAPQTADDSEIEVNPINPLLLSQKHRIGIHSVDIEVQHYRKDKLNFFGFLDIHLIFDPIDHMKELEESDWEGSWRKMLIVQPRSIKYDRWQLSHQFAVGSRWTTSAGRGGWHDAYTMDGLVRELLERVEELKAWPWGDCDTNVRPADADTWEHL
ncbi:unnamed protein product [Zymoseptoria tritici ST99CH_3D7]|uniref:Uncharacterized protein n=1 Tax=Zymoseptoria tritici (strain ST99CH_3D7) TaxID=1276538 RepID=A0A1X7SAC2_ZYMT9|nr:unnamed protein product [Zymoseptoria tritici ST99CH_3D7]